MLSKNVFAVVFVVLVQLTATGVLSGYNALQNSVLQGEGVWSSLCDAPSSASMCSAQRLRLNMIFSVAFTLLYAAVLPIGMLIDRFGGPLVFAASVTLHSSATLLTVVRPSDWMWTTAIVAYGVASPGLFTAAFTLPYRFSARYSALVTSLIVSGFDTGAVTFFAIAELYDARLAQWPSIGVAYALIVLVFGYTACLFMAEGSIDDEQVIADEKKPLLINDDELSMQRKESSPPESASSSKRLERAPLSSRLVRAQSSRRSRAPRKAPTQATTLRSILLSWPFIGVALFQAIFSLKNSFFIGTFAAQMTSFGVPASANALFDVALIVGGVVALPAATLLLSLNRERDDVIYLVVLALGLAHGVLNCFANRVAQYIGICIFVILRPLKWSVYSEFIIKRFPLQYLGRTTGTGSFVIGLFSLLIYLGDYVSTSTFRHNYVPVNAFLTACELLLVVFPLYLYRAKLAM